jgi:UDP-N-acetylglucosamine acyltransferase
MNVAGSGNSQAFASQTMSQIHSTAVIHPTAVLDSSVSVGPYSVIEAEVRIGKGSRIGPHCHILERTVLGSDNVVHAGCVLGDAPQDLSYKGAATRLVIGDRNIIREHITMHRGTKDGTETVVGNDGFFMANCHVAHNCRIGNHVIVVNGVLLGGYVEVEDRAFIGGGAVVHQYCRIGGLSIIRGLSRISKDVPPYCMTVENNELSGLNSVGLKRAGFSLQTRSSLKEAYRVLFHGKLNRAQAIESLEKNELVPEVSHLVNFIKNSKRGTSTARKSPTDLGEEELASVD